jgi:hypothetical protein
MAKRCGRSACRSGRVLFSAASRSRRNPGRVSASRQRPPPQQLRSAHLSTPTRGYLSTSTGGWLQISFSFSFSFLSLSLSHAFMEPPHRRQEPPLAPRQTRGSCCGGRLAERFLTRLPYPAGSGRLRAVVWGADLRLHPAVDAPYVDLVAAVGFTGRKIHPRKISRAVKSCTSHAERPADVPDLA